MKWIEEGHRIGLIFADGVIFLRCLTIEKTFYENWSYGIDLLASKTGSQLGYEVKDVSAQKLLEVPYEQRKTMMLQVALGINPPWVRVYPEYPSGHKVGRIPGIDPIQVGNPYGFKTGEDAPFLDCSDALEFFSIYGFSPTFNFYNPHETRKAQPCLRIEMTKASVEVYNPDDPLDRELIGKMARGIATVRLVSVGPIEDPAAWKLIDGWPKPIKMEAAKELYKGK
jgi:hypothetical protein